MKELETQIAMVIASIWHNNMCKFPIWNEMICIAKGGQNDVLPSSTPPKKKTHAPMIPFWSVTSTTRCFIYSSLDSAPFAHESMIKASLIRDLWSPEVQTKNVLIFFAVVSAPNLVSSATLLPPHCQSQWNIDLYVILSRHTFQNQQNLIDIAFPTQPRPTSPKTNHVTTTSSHIHFHHISAISTNLYPISHNTKHQHSQFIKI